MSGGWQYGTIRRGSTDGCRRIVKLGGSLLAKPAWPDLVAALVREQSYDREIVLVVGGGAIVDGLRAIDAAHPLPQELTHRLAIESLGATARIVAATLGLPLDGEPARVRASVLDLPAWLDREDRFAKLPVGWHVTSDSLAAAVAVSHACDLLLAKSVPPPCRQDDALELLVQAGWVDGFFAAAAAPLAGIAWASPASVPPPLVGGSGSERRGADRDGIA